MTRLHRFARMAGVVFGFLNWTAAPAGAAIHWEDVDSWKLVGNRFAAGYASDGTILAVYDLSYPDLRSRIELGHFGNPRIGPDTLTQAWNDALETVTEIPDFVQAAIDEFKRIPKEVIGESVFPKDWWKGLPWNNGAFFTNGEPQSFRLSDLDLKKLHLPGQFFSDLRELYRQLIDADDRLSDSQLLGSFLFVRAPEGGYRVSWSYPETPLACEFRKSVTRPRKLVDLTDPHLGLVLNFEIELLQNGLSSAAELSPVPVVQAAVATAISRLAHYFEMTRAEHLEMLHELIVDAQDPVVGQLNGADLNRWIDAYEFARTSPGDSWQWFFTSARGAWQKTLSREQRNSALSESWLRGHGVALQGINTRFSWGVDGENLRKLYLLSQQAPYNRIGPITSIDYANVQKVIDLRILMEMVDLGIEFGSHFVPQAGAVVRGGYNWLVQNRIDATQIWEARLTQYLESRSGSVNWETELSILEGQRMNPFEISRAQMNQLIAERRRLIGL